MRKPYRDYSEVPWYRRSSVNTVLVFVSLVLLFPVLWVCGVMLTGDVVTKQKDADGNLKTWGVANKIAAVVFLLLGFAIWWFGVFPRKGDLKGPLELIF